MTGIYLIRNIINNKIYIGRCSNFERRIKRHKSDLRNNKHHSFLLQRAFNKYGIDKFEFKLFEKCPNEKCYDREQYWLDTLKPFYNLLKSSRGGRYGKHSEITIEKMRKVRQDKSGKEVYQYDLDNNFIQRFNCLSDAMRALNKKTTAHIIQCCKHQRKTSYGYKWSYIKL